MQLNNKGFFLPMIMIFITIFVTLISFVFYETLSTAYFSQAYEKEVYYEVGLLKSKELIKKKLRSTNKYNELCIGEEMTYYSDFYQVNIKPICIIDTKYNTLMKYLNLKTSKEIPLQIDYEEYDHIISKINKLNIQEKEYLIKVLKYIKKSFNKLIVDLEISQPEMILLKKSAVKKYKSKFIFYITFDINIQVKQQENKILYIYNFSDPDNSILRYV